MNGEMSSQMPNGELQGDSKGMPDAGTTTGMPDNVADGGKDLGQSATNRSGGIAAATRSDNERDDSEPGDEDAGGLEDA